MFLGSKIAQQRKEKNITQTDLASDICTQNTISKIEKHNVPPTTKILIKLCQRIDLTLNDVFSDFSQQNSTLDNQLRDIELALYNYSDDKSMHLEGQIALLADAQMTDAQGIQFHFVNAFLKFRQGKFEDAIFECDKVIASTHSDDQNVYTTLAYTIKGDSYKQLDKLSNADYYFNIVSEFIVKHQANHEEINCEPIQTIFVCNQLAHYYVLTNDFKKTMDIAQLGIRLNDRMHTTYFMHSLFEIASEAGQGLGLPDASLNQYRHFAKLFKEYNSFSNEDVFLSI
ncbi:helix-turn-helix domain-containing protein [Lactobacillaceae bacterium Melli_B4]